MPFRKKYWYWNIETKKPEFGRVSRTEKLLGPYRSREEAEQAPQIVRERNAQWVSQENLLSAEQQHEKARDADPNDRSNRATSAPASDQGGQKALSAGQVGGSASSDDDWPSWKEFLEQPSQEELTREKREGTGRPPAFFGDTSALGVVGDDENGTFEQRIARFQKDRAAFEQQARSDERRRRENDEQARQQSRAALEANRRQADRLLEDQERTLPGTVGRSLHVWSDPGNDVAGNGPEEHPSGEHRSEEPRSGEQQ